MNIVEHVALNIALDVKHAVQDCPNFHDYDYKSFYSLVLLAICDTKTVLGRCWAIRQ